MPLRLVGSKVKMDVMQLDSLIERIHLGACKHVQVHLVTCVLLSVSGDSKSARGSRLFRLERERARPREEQGCDRRRIGPSVGLRRNITE